ncbi:hypothetical protein T484DRAFT_1857902 [Baffinella frigidus]|nr:hypothetical protein T484DRAFT_1857902 [Cryptophyta sp. CCMP2293]
MSLAIVSGDSIPAKAATPSSNDSTHEKPAAMNSDDPSEALVRAMRAEDALLILGYSRTTQSAVDAADALLRLGYSSAEQASVRAEDALLRLGYSYSPPVKPAGPKPAGSKPVEPQPNAAKQLPVGVKRRREKCNGHWSRAEEKALHSAVAQADGKSVWCKILDTMRQLLTDQGVAWDERSIKHLQDKWNTLRKRVVVAE